MTNYPLMFTVRDVVSGDGFLAGITLSGRALMCKEEDEKWWAYGVRPAGIAAYGTSPQEAFHQFRDRYRMLLFDMAEESSGFAAFKEEVERLYNQLDEEEEGLWTGAFREIRAGRAEIEKPFAELPKVSPDKWPTSVAVVPLHLVKRFTAVDNIPDAYAFAAAA